MGMITNDWVEPLSTEFRKPYYKDLYNFVRDEYSKTIVYPPADDIFIAFHFTPLKDVKVYCWGRIRIIMLIRPMVCLFQYCREMTFLHHL